MAVHHVSLPDFAEAPAAMAMGTDVQEAHVLTVRESDKAARTPLQAAHAILAEHNMPYGLLPMESLIECIYNPVDGRIKVTQAVGECDATFGGHRLKLMREVTGVLTHNSIAELKGVKVKAAPFIWLNVWQIETDPKPGKMIHFKAGPFSATMPVQELWEYKFWSPAFHAVPEKEQQEGLPMGKAKEHLSKLASKLHSSRNTALSGARV